MKPYDALPNYFDRPQKTSVYAAPVSRPSVLLRMGRAVKWIGVGILVVTLAACILSTAGAAILGAMK